MRHGATTAMTGMTSSELRKDTGRPWTSWMWWQTSIPRTALRRRGGAPAPCDDTDELPRCAWATAATRCREPRVPETLREVSALHMLGATRAEPVGLARAGQSVGQADGAALAGPASKASRSVEPAGLSDAPSAWRRHCLGIFKATSERLRVP